jgi:LCP family protein required for cell wall assembly
MFKKRYEPRHATYPGVFRSVRKRPRRLRLPRLRRWQAIVVAVVLLIGGSAGWAVYFYFNTQGVIQDPGIEGVSPEDAPGEPFNVLLVGSDSRAGLSEQEQLELGAGAQGVEGERADTLILAHVDPATNEVVMVQFPRDYVAEIPGHGRAKINAALTYGRTTLVRTVEQLTGIDINHYIQVDIRGFRDLVDAIGGVDVCIPEPIPFDDQTGLEITPEQVGMVHFGGDDALRFVRSRKVFATGDFARIQNQQKFLAAAIDKVLSLGTLFDPVRIRRLISVARNHLRIDRHTTIAGVARIAGRFRSFDPDRYEAYTAPNLGTGSDEVLGSVVVPDPETLAVMFEAIADNRSPAEADGVPDVDPTTVRVGVYNGTGEEGTAARASRALQEALRSSEGTVDVVEEANAKRFGHEDTIVRYNQAEPEAEQMAELVAAALPGARVEAGRTSAGVDVAVIVGERFEIRRVVQIVPLPLPKPGALPEVCADDAEVAQLDLGPS